MEGSPAGDEDRRQHCAPLQPLALNACRYRTTTSPGREQILACAGSPLNTRQPGMHENSALLHFVTRSIEYGGIAIIVIGAVVSVVRFLIAFARGREDDPFRLLRSRLGRSILLGLEFLVAADIIATVAIEPTLESVAVLAGVVLIRTFLSFSLEVEIEGRWPWRRHER
jgi:uncharacterized membrane protein